MDAKKMASVMNAIEKAWMKWNDKAVTAEEKQSIKAVIERNLAKLPKDVSGKFDWKDGKFHLADFRQQQQQAEKEHSQRQENTNRQQARTNQQTNQKTNQQTNQKQEPKQRTAGTWTTKELAEYLSKLFGKPMTAKTLRRYLRSMDEYNDGKVTHYAWSGQNDEAVKRIVEFIKGKAGQSA